MTTSYPAVVAKTASYTIKPPMDRDGTLFTNRGATGAIVFTLPEARLSLKGYRYRFLTVADQDVTIATATADTALVKNDAAADSLAASTGGEKIGAVMEALCDGTQWAIIGASVGHTFTVAT